ncbi:MAG: hypothetical protein ACW98U_01445 [Candidatus Thorarchaeota archaeon]|jgi:uncharacterized membrane protein
MNDDVKNIIEAHIKKTGSLLPDGFETEDLLEDLRAHIHQSYSDKLAKKPGEDPKLLIREVLDELGTPEEISEQYGKEQIEESDEGSTTDKWIRFSMRVTAIILVVVLASWVASTLTEGVVDFNLAVVTLLALAILEWYVRTQQTKDA